MVKFGRKGEESQLPLPGADYPEQLRGLIWMDQSGFYGKSETGSLGSLPDLLVSFAGTLDKDKRESIVDPTGPGWTWMNKWKAYHLWTSAFSTEFQYRFEWNEDYTMAHIYPTYVILGKRV